MRWSTTVEGTNLEEIEELAREVVTQFFTTEPFWQITECHAERIVRDAAGDVHLVIFEATVEVIT